MDMTTIGKRIGKCRKSKGFYQETLAEMVGISATYMCDIERGHKVPKFETFIRIANALKASSDELLADVVIAGNEAEASMLSKKIAALPDREQKHILHVVEVVVRDATAK